MINVTPIAITATSQEYACSVVENLCQAYCLAQSIQPQSAVSYSIAGNDKRNNVCHRAGNGNGDLSASQRQVLL